MRGAWMMWCALGVMMLIMSLAALSCELPAQAPPEMEDREQAGNADRDDLADEQTHLFTGQFHTGTRDKVVLAVNPRFRLYVADCRLVYESENHEPMVLFRWERDLPAEALAAGSHLLIGIDDEFGEWGWAERWLAVDMQIHPVPAVTAVREFFGPAQLLDVRHHDAIGLVITVRNNHSYSELYYDPRQADFRVINYVDTPGFNWEQRAAAQPERIAPIRPFDRAIRYTSDGVDVWALEDDRGTILYSPGDSGYVWRFFGHFFKYVRLMADIRGRNLPLGLFETPQGSEVVALIGPEHPLCVPGDDLFEAGWMRIEGNSFYRRTADGIETLRYDWRGGNPESRSYEVAEPYVGRTGSLLEYLIGGEQHWLSLFDLRDVVPPAPVQELWLRRAVVEMWGSGERPFPWQRSTVSVTLPVLQPRHAGVPKEIQQSIVFPDHNYGPGITFRLFDNVWYALADDELYVIRSDQAELIGTIPVRVARTLGWQGLSAQDFVRLDGGWVVADTYGSHPAQRSTGGNG